MLNFRDLPIAETRVWETLEEQQRTLVLEALARLIAKATRITEEESHDR
jgi:TRAP-type C4-dicarboxylate transport system substrate-binding protein